jgi:hypothetical protein
MQHLVQLFLAFTLTYGLGYICLIILLGKLEGGTNMLKLFSMIWKILKSRVAQNKMVHLPLLLSHCFQKGLGIASKVAHFSL